MKSESNRIIVNMSLNMSNIREYFEERSNRLLYYVSSIVNEDYVNSCFFDLRNNIIRNIEENKAFSSCIFKFSFEEVYSKMYRLIEKKHIIKYELEEKEFTEKMIRYEIKAFLDEIGLNKKFLEKILFYEQQEKQLIYAYDLPFSKKIFEYIDYEYGTHIIRSEFISSNDLIEEGYTKNITEYLTLKYLNRNNVSIIEQQIFLEKKLESLKFFNKELKTIFCENYNKNHLSNYVFPLYVFIKRLYDLVLYNQHEEVFFLAREGKFLKELFDEYCADKGEKIKSHYLEVSRNSLLLPSLSELENEEFKEIFKGKVNISIIDFLKTLTFTEDEIEELILDLNVNVNNQSQTIKKSEWYPALRESDRFKTMYSEKRAVQKRLLYRYLSQFGISENEKNIAIVDVGWGGTMQNCLCRLFPNTLIKGYYLGLCIQADIFNEYNKKYGVLFNELPYSLDKQQKIFKYNMFDYEIILKSNTCKTNDYIERNNMVIANYEKSNDINIYEMYIRDIQKKIKSDFLKIMKLYNKYKYYDCNDTLFTKYTVLLCAKMRVRDLCYKINVQKNHYEGFGNCGEIYINRKLGKNDIILLLLSKIRIIKLYLRFLAWNKGR